MNLVPISENVLINPEAITCIEQRIVGGVDITYVWIGDRAYILNIPLNEFYKSLRLKEDESKVTQGFAG